jgi:hypothetical protein
MMKKVVFLLGMFVIFLSGASAQFTLSGELRPRMELRHGYSKLPSEDSLMAAFVSQRSRLNLSYESEKFNTFVSFQEVRVWGAKGMFETLPGVGLNQAYADVKIFEGFSLKVGRQQIRLDNQRFFAINNWNQAGRTHDAAVLNMKHSGWNLQLGGAFNQDKEQLYGTDYTRNQYKTLNFLWINKMFGKAGFSALAVMDGFDDPDKANKTYFRSTFGGIFYLKPGKQTIELHGFKQNGKTKNGQEINAWYVHLVGRLRPAQKLHMIAGIEILSGKDKTTGDLKYRSFDPLYSANHAFNGHLDYFTNVTVHTKEGGLVNPYINLVYNLTETVNLKADYHYFALQNKLLDANNQVVDKYLGSEIDISFQYFITKQADLQLGYSTMFASKSMEFLKGGSHKEPIHWGWVMLTVKPVFFTAKN